MYLLASQNSYPEGITLTLDTIIPPQDSNKGYDIPINLRFAEQKLKILEGNLTFRLRGGQLTLKTAQGELIPSSCPFSLVSATPSQLIWDIKLNLGKNEIPLVYSSLNVAQFLPSTSEATLEVIFTLTPSDIILTGTENLWKHDITPNKHAILERAMVRRLYPLFFTPYLSYLKLGLISQTEKIPENPLNPLDSSLDALITTIYHAKTDNFLELAKLANLNPLVDLAGGNLVGTCLSGLNLSEANLSFVNLRGADLTDGDLSEAILDHANLSGADLSGAYLGNAKLRYADLYRGSLALANLIGADLSHANLKEVNLSQTNLSSAIVTHAILGKNIGIAPEAQANLEQRGAIFVTEDS